MRKTSLGTLLVFLGCGGPSTDSTGDSDVGDTSASGDTASNGDSGQGGQGDTGDGDTDTASIDSGGDSGGAIDSGGGVVDSGLADSGSVAPSDMMDDFALTDMNPNSPRYGEVVSPRDYLEQVSGWYFIQAS